MSLHLAKHIVLNICKRKSSRQQIIAWNHPKISRWQSFVCRACENIIKTCMLIVMRSPIAASSCEVKYKNNHCDIVAGRAAKLESRPNQKAYVWNCRLWRNANRNHMCKTCLWYIKELCDINWGRHAREDRESSKLIYKTCVAKRNVYALERVKVCMRNRQK